MNFIFVYLKPKIMFQPKMKFQSGKVKQTQNDIANKKHFEFVEN